MSITSFNIRPENEHFLFAGKERTSGKSENIFQSQKSESILVQRILLNSVTEIMKSSLNVASVTLQIYERSQLFEELNSGNCFEICNAYFFICSFRLIGTWFPFTLLYEE